jgi:hypothetical protein
MLRKNWRAIAGLAITATLVFPVLVKAGDPPQETWRKTVRCPPGSYPPKLYWTPELYRIHWHLHCPRLPLYARDRFPGIPVSYRITPYPCPPVDPREIPYGWRASESPR